MAAGLDGQWAVHALPVQPQGLVYHVLIPPPKSVVPAIKCALYILLQAVRGDGVGDYCAPGSVLQSYGRGHSHQLVAVYLPAAAVHHPGPVHVRVEDYPQVRPRLSDRPGGKAHGLLILRVGDVVGEPAVRLQKPAAADIGPQRRQHLFSVEPSRAVARVHGDMKARKGPMVVRRAYPPLYQVPKMGGIDLHMVRLPPAAPGGLLGTSALSRKGQYLREVRAVKPAVLRKELQPVPMKGMMTGGYLHRAVTGDVQHRHEHGGR